MSLPLPAGGSNESNTGGASIVVAIAGGVGLASAPRRACQARLANPANPPPPLADGMGGADEARAMLAAGGFSTRGKGAGADGDQGGGEGGALGGPTAGPLGGLDGPDGMPGSPNEYPAPAP